MKRIVTVAIVMAAAVLGTALAQELVLGWSGAVTGPTSDAGQFVVQGVEDYCAYANDEGLIPGVSVRCLTKDDGYDNDNTLRNFEGFLDQGMQAFISYATGATLQLKVNAMEEEMPVLSASLHIANIDPPDNAYNFLPITSYSEQVVALLDWIHANDDSGTTPKVAMLIHPSAFGRAPVEDAQKAADLLGIDIVEVIEHGEGLDYTATLQRWANAGVRYVIGQSVQSPIAAMLQAAQALGLKDQMTFLGAHYTGGSTLVNLAGDAADGFLWTTSFKMAYNIPLQREIGERYGRSEETIADVNYTTGLLQTAIYVEAARRAVAAGEGVDKDAIYRHMLMMNADQEGVFDTPFAVGPVSFSDTDRVGVDALHLLEDQGGRFVSVSEPFQSDTFRTVHPPQ